MGYLCRFDEKLTELGIEIALTIIQLQIRLETKLHHKYLYEIAL